MATNFWEKDTVVSDQWWSQDPEVGKQEEAPRRSTIGSELVRGGKQLASSIRTGVGALTGSPEEAAAAGVARSQAIGEEAGEGASFEAVKKAYEKDGLLSAAGEVASQIPRALAGQVPQLAAMAGGAKLGAMAGTAVAPGPGTIIGGVLGAGATLLPQFFGSNVERQAAEQMAKDQPVQIDRTSAGAAAAGQAAIESAGTAFVLGKRIVKGVLGIADDAALSTAKAQQAMTQAAERSLAAAAGRGVAKGVATEIPVEIASSVLERAQAGLDVTSPEALAEYGEVAYQAGLVGGAIGAGAGPVDTAMARQGVKARTAFEEAEAKRKADEEQARLDAEAAEKAKIPPLALGSEGVFTPVALPDGSVAMTREELAQYEEQQFQKKYAAQEADKKEQEVLALSDQGVFKPTPLPDGSVAMTREDLEAYEEQQFRKKYEPVKVEQPPTPEPYVKPASISGTKPDALLGERADPLAGAVTARREAAEPKSEVPLVDDYAFLQREKQRLLQQDQTPDTKKLLGRIDEQLGTILKRDIERQRADAEAAKTSVFSEKELPPVENRDVVVGNLELGKLQAQERLPDQPITSREIKSAEKMRTAPPPVDDAQARLEQAEMDRRKFMRSKEAKQGNLMDYLKGKLALDEVSDIAPKGKGFEKLANEKGTYISELVSDGMLDEFLPPDQRAGQANFDAQTAAETIKENLRNKNLRPFELQMQIRQLDESVAAAEREAKEPSTAQFDLSEVEPGEAASVERAAGDQAVGAVTDIRYQRSTTGGKSIGKQQTQSVVDAVKSQWSNAPEVVVAESMDDTAIPEAVRAHNKEAIAKGAKGSPKGFFYKGKAYILADSMTSANDAVETLFHESLGHYGLRGTFGPEMSKVLADVVKNRKADVEAKARQYGLDVNSKEDMLEAAEEVLAEMAQTKPGLSFVKRAIAVIRNFLRDLGLPFKMSNEDIIQKYILPARAFVEKGERRAAEGKPAASRQEGGVQFYEDIPNENWLQGKIDYALRSPRNEFGVPKMSSVTGSFKSPVMVPTRWFQDARGQRGEEKNVRQKDLEAIRKIIRDTGKFPLNDDGTEYVPYVEIGYDGKPWVSEGNHRIMAAIAEGMEYMPIELRYFDGGQRRAGKFAPENIKEITERVSQERPAAMREPAKAPPTDSAAFKKWFGDSKVVDENGEPMVVYHSTTSDFEAFDTSREALGGAGSWFSVQPSYRPVDGEEGARVMPVYLSLQNPKVFDFAKESADYRKENLVKQGYDGVVITINGELKVAVAFEPTQIKSATGNIGTYDPENPDIRYQREATQEAEVEPTTEKPTRQNIFGEPVLGTWSITVDPKMELQDGLIYKMLDKNIDVKRVVEAVKKTGKEIATKWNPYLQEELYHGRTAEASKQFQDNEWLPLLQDMQKKDVTIGELEKYLLNRHAEDYNKLVAKRNPNRPEMQDGGSSVTTEAARKYLADLDPKTKAKYEELAKRVDSITKGTRQLLVDTGYEKAETVKGWEKAFPNYVPLMREEMDFDYNFGSFGTGRGFDVRRDFSRSAMGSKRNVVDIIGNVIAARNNAIALTEKNRVAQAVYGLALEAPNPDFWMAINPEAEKVPQDAIDELRAMGLDEDAVKFLMKEPKQRMLDPKKNEVISRVNTKLRENDFVLATRVNGERRYVLFNPKDPRSARAATALKNLDAQDLGTTMGMIAKVTRWMASVNTQYNPIFGPYNFLRDIQAGALQLSTTELAGQQKEIAKLVVPSMGAIYSSLRKRRKGETVDSDMAKLWKEFQSEGGQTGFRDNFSRTQDRTEALLTEMEKLTEGKLKAGGRAVFDWLSDYNDSLENAVRLSAYKVAKDKFKKEGVSDAEAKQRAASLAKNLTVNFNRKGDVATQMGALYAFFNASMQGSARMIETLKGPMGNKIMGGGLLLGSMQALLLASVGFDDEEPPEFIRSKNILIPTGDGKYIAFPMPLGFHVIPGFSRILTEWAMSGFDDTARRVTDLTGLFLDAFNPVGNAGWSVQTIAPTILDPFVALGENKDFTGKPISKEDMFSLNPTPGYSRAREGANFLTTALAEFLNAASGGDKDRQGVISPTPEQIEYLIGQATGGVGRELVKLTTTIDKTITGEDLPPYKIPLYGRFVGETKSAAAESNKFYKNMKELNELNNVVKGRRDRREPLGDFLKENPEARLLPLANKTFKDVQELRKRRKALLERNAPKASIEAVEKMITRKMQVLNDRVRALEERN